MIFETERLLLRRMDQRDLPALRDMLQDPLVMTAYEHMFSEQDVLDWLSRQQRHYQEDGFGLWAVVRKADGEMVGQAGLTMQRCEDRRVLEIGYLLRRAHWGMGYATEAALGCKRHAFETLGHNRVYSVIKQDNFASQRVAERLGMVRVKSFLAEYYNGPVPHYLYEARKK